MTRVIFGVTVPFTARAFLTDQVEQLASRGVDVHLITSSGNELEEAFSAPGVTVDTVPMTRAPSLRRDIVALSRWIGLLRRLRPDAVVVGTPKAALLGIVSSRLTGVETRIYHARGLRAEGLSGIPRIISLVSERVCCYLATDVVADSGSLLLEMRRLSVLGTEKGQVLAFGSACGVNTEHYRPASTSEKNIVRSRLGLEPSDIVIGFVGRITSDKGIRELLGAFSRLRDRNVNLRLLLVGPIEESHFLNDLADLESIGVHHISYQEDPRDFYWAFDIFCLPSYREGFPISALEAASSALPVITTSATGCRDAIVDGLTGALAEPGDIASLATVLSIYINDGNLRMRTGLTGRKRVLERYDSQQVVGNWNDFILTTMSNRCERRIFPRKQPGGTVM